MKLGSLFDGSGGFPLAGLMNGIEPVWSSEIEPYPMKVTAARFPNMTQLGDVTKINGAEIEPVDVVTFGSPCQDLSVAGKQAGIHDGERSNLFFEAVRVIKEMREHDRNTGRADEHLRPRFAVWENVPGAFSSNKGADFQAVLQALCEVADPCVSVPVCGKWQKAGCIVGDGYSVAWRVYDAQFWGVPQRRKRIYLVADFGSERAGEILFESEGVRWDSAQGGEAREGTAEDAEGSVGRSSGVGSIVGFDAFQHHNWRESKTLGTLTTAGGTVRGDTPLVVSCGTVYCLQGNGIDRALTAGCNGKGWRNGECYTLNTIDRPAVVYGIDPLSSNSMKSANPNSGFHEMNIAKCLDTTDGNPSKNQGGMCVVYDTTQITSPMNYSNPKPGDPCHPLAAQQHPPLAVSVGNGQLNQISMAEKSNTLDCMHDQQAILTSGKPPRKYIVRRLTPLECCRLQGFPDWWEDGVEGSDSARYKMWGNGIALPCAEDVLRRIARAMAEQWAWRAEV